VRLSVVPGRFAVCRLAPEDPIPAALLDARLVSITRTAEELSIVCPEELAPSGARGEAGWAWLALEGPIPFTATGIMSSLLAPLAEAKVGIFAISTYDTDAILVKQDQLAAAVAALEQAGHVLSR
jgi:uncharacterized protein